MFFKVRGYINKEAEKVNCRHGHVFYENVGDLLNDMSGARKICVYMQKWSTQ